MALVFKDRVKVTSTTAGTGTLTLGSAASGFQDFSVIGNGNTTYYTITDQSGNWEVGIGTYTSSGTTLSRDTILESSNGGTAVDFPAGTKTVFVTYPAEKSVIQDASGNVTLQGVLTPSGGISNGATFNKTGSGGEGGELHLEKGATSTLSGDVVIDAYNQSVRIFENSGTNRGAQLDLSSQSAGVGSTILTTASTVGIANGGTGQTTAAAAFNALSPITTAGDLILGNGTNNATRLAIGSSNQVLTSNGTTASWQTPAGSSAKTWTAYTATGTYTVPTGVSSIRAYAFGKGGNGGSNSSERGGGGGGGCAFGDIAVTAGQTVSISISSGIATVTYNGTTMLTANPGSTATASTAGGAGGSASKDASVTNGGAYSGGTGGAGYASAHINGGGGSAGSPLGNGYAGGAATGGGSGGGGGAGGVGGDSHTSATQGGGGGGGAGGAGSTLSNSNNNAGAGGGAGGAATAARVAGVGRYIGNMFSDPLMQQCMSPGAHGGRGTTTYNYIIPGNAGGPGAGGGGGAYQGGVGGAFGGGGGCAAFTNGYGGAGGFAGGGGGGCDGGTGGVGGLGGGGGGGGNSAAGGAAIVLIYA